MQKEFAARSQPAHAVPTTSVWRADSIWTTDAIEHGSAGVKPTTQQAHMPNTQSFTSAG